MLTPLKDIPETSSHCGIIQSMIAADACILIGSFITEFLCIFKKKKEKKEEAITALF